MMDQQDAAVHFCEWLKRRRKALDMTQEELAQRTGCSIGTLRKIESGERRPSKQLAGLLATALGVPHADVQAFIRVARGELAPERLRPAAADARAAVPDLPGRPQPRPVTPAGAGLPPSRIPVQATSLLGREEEIAALERLFYDPQCRLLTLTGIGGIGKTRLAIEFATRKQGEFPAGVFYVPLASVESPGKIIPAIAGVFGFVFSGPSDPREQLLGYAAANLAQPALFVFDNLEHLLAPAGDGLSGVAGLVPDFLRRIPSLRILATSRERLNLHGEWTYELHGLSVPPAQFAGRVEDYTAAALFARSARRTRADFQISHEDEAAVIQICRLVDGVPLAIELAAAWVAVLSCREIAQEIKSSLDFLTTSMRDIPERHRSIRATFDHSWKLLSGEERQALCQLSVFHGGFDRAAAERIAGASLPLLASLSSKSLVRRTDAGRYDLHEVIRQHAFAHLKADAQFAGTHARHGEYYLGLLQDHEAALKSAEQQDAIRRLTGEIDNIRAAWAWAIENAEFARLGQAGRAFGWYFEITGLYREGIEQLELLVQAAQAGPQDQTARRAWGLALMHQALLLFRKGEFFQARTLYEESIGILRPIGDSVLLADALIFLGTILHLNGEYARARSLLEDGLALARDCHARWFEAFAIFNLGYVDSLAGRYAEGHAEMLDGLAAWRMLGDPQVIALGLNFMVPTLNRLGRYEEAKACMRESIALCEQSKNRWGQGTAYRYLGSACIAAGQYVEAQDHLLRSLEIFGEFAIGWDIARSLTYLGDATLLAGNLPKAAEIYQDALESSIEAQAVPIELDALLGLAEVQALTGSSEQALVATYHILNHPASEVDTQSRATRLRAGLEADLGPERAAAAHGRAEQTSLDDLVKRALEAG